MAVTKYNNTVLIARGDISNKKTLAYGELFFDKSSSNLFIGTKKDGADSDPARLGGFDSLTIKGVITGATLPTAWTDYANRPADAKNLVAGDSYILANDITLYKTVSTGNWIYVEGDTLPTDAKAVQVLKWKKGDLIIYTGLSNAISEGQSTTTQDLFVDGWFYVNCGVIDAGRVAFDSTNSDIISKNENLDIDTVQDALQYLFNTHLIYEGEITDTDNVTTISGTFQLYSGKVEGTVKNGDTEVAVKPQSLVLYQDGIYYSIPLGAAGAYALDASFTTKRDFTYGSTVATKDSSGEATTISDDDDVSSVQQALDWLHHTKADLQSNGKIPLSQIPDTLVGSLQYKATITGASLAEAITAGTLTGDAEKLEFTSATLAAYLRDTYNKTSSGTNIDDDNNETVDDLDAGDYFILSGTTNIIIDGTTYNSGDWLIYDGTSFDQLNASSAVDNVNGLKAAVTIEGATRTVNGTSGVKEVTVTTDSATNIIKVDAENAVLEPEEITAQHLPMATTGKGVKDSGLIITDATADDKIKIGDGKVDVELPAESGRAVVIAESTDGKNDGTVPVFDDNGGIKDSRLYDTGTEAGVASAKGMMDGRDVALVYDDTNGTVIELNSKKAFLRAEDAHSDAKNKTPTAAAPANILDDTSVIDCGEW